MTNQAKRYSPEFKQSLVALYHNEKKSMSSLSREYGVTVSSISRWIDDEKIISFDQGKPISQKMQKENQSLKEELEILKAAAMILGKK